MNSIKTDVGCQLLGISYFELVGTFRVLGSQRMPPWKPEFTHFDTLPFFCLGFHL
jgi:hypothetical protein